MPTDEIRARQLTRILGHPVEAPVAIEDARAIADAIFGEAADSDDVTSEADAAAYLASRLAFFGDMFSPPLADAIREHFIARWRAWEQV